MVHTVCIIISLSYYCMHTERLLYLLKNYILKTSYGTCHSAEQKALLYQNNTYNKALVFLLLVYHLIVLTFLRRKPVSITFGVGCSKCRGKNVPADIVTLPCGT